MSACPSTAPTAISCIARLISALGTWTAFFAVRIALFEQTNSAWWISILLFCELVPGVILGIAVGPLIDRWPRQRMMILSDLGGAACFGALPFVHSPAGICAALCPGGLLGGVLPPRLLLGDTEPRGRGVPRRCELPHAGSGELRHPDGALIAAVGIALLGSSTVYALNAVSFIFSALFLVRIGNRLQSELVARIGRTHWREVRAGLALVRNDRHLSSIFLIWSWATLAYAGINVAEIVLTTDAYGAGDIGFGVFVAFSAGGILVGSVVAFWFIDRLTVYGGYRASFLITAAGVAICAVSPSLAIGCVGAVIFGVGNGVGLVCNVTLIQQVVSDERRGQTFAVLGSLVQTFTLLGTLAAGPITDAVGPRMMWGISAFLLVIGYFNAVLVSSLRRAREPGLHREQSTCGPSRSAVEMPGGEIPNSGFARLATLLDEVERTRDAEAEAALLDATGAAHAQPTLLHLREERLDRSAVSAGRAAGNGELILGVPDALLDLPAVA